MKAQLLSSVKDQNPFVAAVLRNWQPSVLNEKNPIDRAFWSIRKEFYELLGLKAVGVVVCDVRTPEDGKLCASSFHNRGPYKKAVGWHLDGVSDGCLLVLWSNILPTEVKTYNLFNGSKPIEFEPGDIIVLDNELVRHRPLEAAATAEDRWFLRANIKRELLLK